MKNYLYQAACNRSIALVLASVIMELYPRSRIVDLRATEAFFSLDMTEKIPSELCDILEQKVRYAIRQGVVIKERSMMKEIALSFFEDQGREDLLAHAEKVQENIVSFWEFGPCIVVSANTFAETITYNNLFTLLSISPVSFFAASKERVESTRFFGIGGSDKKALKAIEKRVRAFKPPSFEKIAFIEDTSLWQGISYLPGATMILDAIEKVGQKYSKMLPVRTARLEEKNKKGIDNATSLYMRFVYGVNEKGQDTTGSHKRLSEFENRSLFSYIETCMFEYVHPAMECRSLFLTTAFRRMQYTQVVAKEQYLENAKDLLERLFACYQLFSSDLFILYYVPKRYAKRDDVIAFTALIEKIQGAEVAIEYVDYSISGPRVEFFGKDAQYRSWPLGSFCIDLTARKKYASPCYYFAGAWFFSVERMLAFFLEKNANRIDASFECSSLFEDKKDYLVEIENSLFSGIEGTVLKKMNKTLF